MVRPILGVLAVALVDAATHANVMGASSASTLRASNAVTLDEFFAALSDEGALASVWQVAPTLWQKVSGARELFSFEDAVAGAQAGLLERVCVALEREAAAGKWVSEYAAPRDRSGLLEALRRGTVFFNGAGLDFPRLAAVARRAQDSLGLPCNVNVYMTEAGRDVSVSPHTDAQDVLVFQTAGRKRWRVWAPPPRRAGRDPFGRGKNGDAIATDEVGEPLVDAWLEPGDVLYVPIGFPHATSTAGGSEGGATSCHVTLGVDTYFYGLCYATLRAVAAGRCAAPSLGPLDGLDDALHARLFAPLPFGFLRPPRLGDGDDDGFVAHVADELRSVNADVAAALGCEAPTLGDDAHVRTCVRYFVDHHTALLDAAKYDGVQHPPKPGTVAALAARAARNGKNAREEATLKRLGAFAAARTNR